MQNYFRKMLLLTTGCLATISFVSGKQFRSAPLGTSGQTEVRKILSRHSALPPVAQFDEPAVTRDSQDEKRRLTRDRLSEGVYTHKVIRDPGVREVNGHSEEIELTFVDGVKIMKPGERQDPMGLPIFGSIIVIGRVSSGKAYVNQNHTGVFSEYKLAITEVLKPDLESVISPGDDLTAWLPGGTLQFQSGHITHFIIAGRNYPEVGTRYVFFLRRPDKNVQDYTISTAYAVKEQIVSPLDDGNDTGSFDGMPLRDFVKKLRKEINDRTPH